MNACACVVIVVCFAFIFGSKLARNEICNKCSMSFARAVAKLQCRRIAASLPRCAVLQFSVCFFSLVNFAAAVSGFLGRKDSWTGNAALTADTSLLTWFILFFFGVRFVVRQKICTRCWLGKYFRLILDKVQEKTIESAWHNTHTHY